MIITEFFFLPKGQDQLEAPKGEVCQKEPGAKNSNPILKQTIHKQEMHNHEINRATKRNVDVADFCQFGW